MGDQNDKAIEDLREVARRLRAGELGDLGLRFAVGLDRYLADAHAGTTLDQALGVKVEPGESPWWIEDERERRNNFLREAARRFCPASSAAATLAHELGRYEAGAWQRDKKHLPTMPLAYAGTLRELLFHALRVNKSIAPWRMPVSERQLRHILASHCSDKETLGGEIPSFRPVEPAATSASNLRGCDDASGKNPKIAQWGRRRRGR